MPFLLSAMIDESAQRSPESKAVRYGGEALLPPRRQDQQGQMTETDT